MGTSGRTWEAYCYQVKEKETTMRKTREEVEFRSTFSKDGSFNPHLCPEVSKRINAYCSLTNQNRTKFVEQCVIESLDVLEQDVLKDILSNKSKEELIQMILSK